MRQNLDKALKAFGFPVGPITLSDEVGTDVAFNVAAFLSQHLDNRMGGANIEGMKAMVDAGLLGRKVKKGFFNYDAKGKSLRTVNPDAMKILEKYRVSTEGEKMDAETMSNRMALRFINEAARCLEGASCVGAVVS